MSGMYICQIYFQTSCLDLSGKCQIESLALREGVFQSFKIYQIVIC